MYCTVHSTSMFRHSRHAINNVYPFGACHASDDLSSEHSPPPCPPPFGLPPPPPRHHPQYPPPQFSPAHTTSWRLVDP